MENKELLRIKVTAQARGFNNTYRAVYVAEELHKGQYRKSGEDYVSHPARVTSLLLARKIYNDEILATALLHDVIEECDISEEELIHKYGIDEKIVKNVRILSYDKRESKDEYYKRIRENPACLLVKIADRCHNVSTMADAFSMEKMKEYVEETERYVLPLCEYGKKFLFDYSDEIFTLKCHIESVLTAIKSFIRYYDKSLEEPSRLR